MNFKGFKEGKNLASSVIGIRNLGLETSAKRTVIELRSEMEKRWVV